MQSRFETISALLLLLAGAAAAHAQTLSLGARAGTFGIGGEAAVGMGRVAVRGGVGVLPGKPSATISGITYEVEPPSPLASAGVDIYVTGNLRFAGGLLFGAQRTDFTGRLAQSVRIGDQIYTPAQAGTLLGQLRSRSAAPFVGIGFGSYGGSPVGLTLDLGIAFLGENDLALSATGPFATDATFQAELEKERLSVEHDLRRYTRLLPMLSLGFHVALLR